jgi:hypothetical protein
MPLPTFPDLPWHWPHAQCRVRDRLGRTNRADVAIRACDTCGVSRSARPNSGAVGIRTYLPRITRRAPSCACHASRARSGACRAPRAPAPESDGRGHSRRGRCRLRPARAPNARAGPSSRPRRISPRPAGRWKPPWGRCPRRPVRAPSARAGPSSRPRRSSRSSGCRRKPASKRTCGGRAPARLGESVVRRRDGDRSQRRDE